ncbi:MAG: hypothetical protein KAW12_07765 [Candidatus Aminicenantes bacterium]|nr:hypothetical protein [Candidatus Aminicenantes bacterium]
MKWLRAAYPGSAAIKNYYAYFLVLQGRELGKALRLSVETLQEEAGNIAFIDTYGYILFKLGRSAESIKYLRKAYEAHPLEEDIIDHIVEYYRLKKEYKKIIEIYKRAIEAGVDFEDRLKEKLAGIEKLFLL